MLKISSVLIGVSSLERSKSFYEAVFGFRFEEFRPPFASAYLGDIEFNIEEDVDYRSPDWAQKNIGKRSSVSFETDNINAFMEKARSLGATIILEPKNTEWGFSEAIVADSDGNEFLVEQELK